jgi:protein gp37
VVPPTGLYSGEVSWVILGGESGPGAWPMDPAWVAEIRDQCVRTGVPLFFKQWGGTRKRVAQSCSVFWNYSGSARTSLADLVN